MSLPRLHIDAGMCPPNWLTERLRFESMESEPMPGGMAPERRLLSLMSRLTR